jgi:hypothetical protein
MDRKDIAWENEDWIYLAVDIAGYYEHCNEFSGSIKGREVTEWLSGTVN